MLYLIQAVYYDLNKEEPINLLKIGYTSNLDNRLNLYKTDNPLYKLINTREGTEEDEKKFHEYYKKFLYPGEREWFYYQQEIVDNFLTLDVSEIKINFCKDTISRNLKKYLKEILPEDLKKLVSNHKFYPSDTREQSLLKFFYSNELWRRNDIDPIKFGINFISDQKELLSDYYKLNNNISYRIKYICETVAPQYRDTFLQQLTNDDYAKSYYLQLGSEKCRALSYNISYIRKELGIVKFDLGALENLIYSEFSIGARLEKSVIKENYHQYIL